MIEKLSQWLEKQGFSLEMRAAAAFRQAGFKVRQSAHYHDRGEGKDREIDVVASQESELRQPAVHFAVECKSSDKPWVVLVSDDTLSGVERARCWGVLTHEGLDTVSTLSPEDLAQLPWYSTTDECGYGFRKAFAGDRDDGFAASAAVCKAAQYLVLPMQMDARALPAYAISFPIIVVDSPLFECRLNADGKLQLSQVTQSEYLFEDHLAFDAWVRIRVVHIQSLPDFAREAFDVATKLRSFLCALPAPRSEEEKVASKFYRK
jgi:hypothetical protein